MMQGNSGRDKTWNWNQRDFGLDSRLIKAIAKLGFAFPTAVQEKCIPIALQGKDILVRSRTGSGKTLAFALPLLSKLLAEKDHHGGNNDTQANTVKAVLLAPTKELCKQIEKQVTDLIYYCRDIISICSLSEDNAGALQFKLKRKPDIIISTPAKIVQSCQSGLLDLSHVQVLVIDEADLVLSFGYSEDITYITSQLPKIFQGLLVSATLSPQLEKFKKVVLHNPIVVKVNDNVSNDNLLQFYLESSESEKFLIIYVFIKLGLLQGKGLIFVNDIDKGYKLKLFLQQFFVSAAVLNDQLPLNSRVHIIEEYNRGVFDLLVATDSGAGEGEEEEDDEDEKEHEAVDDEGEGNDENDVSDDEEEGENDDEEDDKSIGDESGEDEDDNEEDGGDADGDADDEHVQEEEEDLEEYEWMGVEETENNEVTESVKSPRQKLKKNQDTHAAGDNSEEYGVSRGIDFQDVNFVINFDFPTSAANYTHRIGRTARGSRVGTALSLISVGPSKNTHSYKPLSKKEQLNAKIASRDWRVLQEVRHSQPKLGFLENDNILAAIQTPDMTSHGGGRGSVEIDESKMQPLPLNFNMKELDAFRYRVEDTLRSVTSVAVKELRAAEIKREILNSSKLKSYFSENPNDLTVLRHDKSILHPIKQKPHLKNVPSYLIPNSMKSVVDLDTKKSKKRKAKTNVRGQSQEQRMLKSKHNDPLYQTAENESGEVEEASEPAIQGEETKIVYTTKEASNLGRSVAGRREWQLRHKKGKFNQKQDQKNSHRVKGTFSKTKRNK